VRLTVAHSTSDVHMGHHAALRHSRSSAGHAHHLGASGGGNCCCSCCCSRSACGFISFERGRTGGSCIRRDASDTWFRIAAAAGTSCRSG
jgi:hypothetical protein